MGDDDLRISIKKYAGYIKISDEMAMDHGLIPDTRPKPVISRRTRFRWWRQERINGPRIKLASWIAGFDVTDGY